LAELLRRAGEGLLNLKDLLTVPPPTAGAAFSVLSLALKWGGADLLIPQELLLKLPKKAREWLLNLKGLLKVFPPILKRLFENEPVLRSFFCAKSHRISPSSDKNEQISVEYRGFSQLILLHSTFDSTVLATLRLVFCYHKHDPASGNGHQKGEN